MQLVKIQDFFDSYIARAMDPMQLHRMDGWMFQVIDVIFESEVEHEPVT